MRYLISLLIFAIVVLGLAIYRLHTKEEIVVKEEEAPALKSERPIPALPKIKPESKPKPKEEEFKLEIKQGFLLKN